MVFIDWKRPLAAFGLALIIGAAATGCSSDGSDSIDADNDNNGSGGGSGELTDSQINAPDGQLQATIRTTTGGVPHIRADNLESAGFGSGYAQARDNVCLIADSILRARGERAAFYGPGPDVSPSVPVGINVVTDFSYKALRLHEKAEAQFGQLSDISQAMLRGFAAGYNKYVDETAPEDLPGKCAPPPSGLPGRSPVVSITPEDVYAYYQLIALYASGDNFTGGPTFFAAPPGANPAPTPAMSAQNASADGVERTGVTTFARNATPADLGLKTDFNDRGMASNGWGIGSEMTENGKGALLANPHFPYTGNRRLY